MANQGHWTNNTQPNSDADQGTVNLLNSMLLQAGLDAAKDSSYGDTGRMFVATDTYIWYRESGAAWVAVINKDQAAGVASLRTLGGGATQIAAGNHVHN